MKGIVKTVLLFLCTLCLFAGCSKKPEQLQDAAIIPVIDEDTVTKNGVTLTARDGVFTVEGTAEAAWNYNLAGSKYELPEGMEAGETYYVRFDSTERLFVRVIQFDQAHPDGLTILETRSDTRFTVPEDVSGLIIRLHIAKGATIERTEVCPEVLDSEAYLLLMQEEKQSPGPMLTIIDDDGHVGFMRDLLPLIEEKHVSIATAVTTTRIGSAEKWMTWEQILECYSRGAEVLCHTYNHQSDISNLSEDELVMQYTMARNEMLMRGLKGADILVYNNLTGKEEKAQAAAEKVFKCAIYASGREINYAETLEPYFLLRIPVELDPYYYDTEKLQGLIDQVAENGGWMIWIIHTSASSWNENAVQAISDSIDYARQVGVPIVSADYGYKKYVAGE